ncbi:MAG: glutamine--fructose-6-phosphate transaminase (isomerizing) [Candidatus Thermoplasmatota archaeon]|nr:glutamine--fructose-6-phosphate transaminase (isomerizing) [Candidatus Thermoplasmatota archaeon]
MCGIIGYVGFRSTQDVLLESLKRLEYRGYDSSGICIMGNSMQLVKSVGDIQELQEKLLGKRLTGSIGIGHNRWATHGAVNEKNAHPHTSCDKTVVIVHNGIIENHASLRQELLRSGHKFLSDTDSEIFAHLIEEAYRTKPCFKDAVTLALQKVKGSYALVSIHKNQPDTIIAARKENPLVIGVGDQENFVASDIPAFISHTKRVLYLEDGDLAVITKDTIDIYDGQGTAKQLDLKHISWDINDAEKAGFPHYMLKEIYEQADTLQETFRGRITDLEYGVSFHDTVDQILLQPFDSITIIACGTSFYAGLIGKYYIESLTSIPVEVAYASEYRFLGRRKDNALVVAISQSGETADTLAALREAKKNGYKSLVITNVLGSTATRIADAYILTQSGPEIGVAATKTFTAQIIIMNLIALLLSRKSDTVGLDEIHQYIQSLKSLPRKARTVFDSIEDIKQIARQLQTAESVFFVGRGVWYPLALEGALKLKEISYIHAEGFPAGELKHGPFALLTKNTPVVALFHKGVTYDKMLMNIGEIQARGPKIIAIAEDTDKDIQSFADFVLRYPSDNEIISVIPVAIILQLLSYFSAIYRKCPIDKPRNLAKSVTVE